MNNPSRKQKQGNRYHAAGIFSPSTIFTIRQNGQLVTQFQSNNPNKGLSSSNNTPAFMGLQSYPGKRVAFRNIVVEEI